MKNKNKDILNISNEERSYNGAENIKPILEYLENPQNKLKIIHIAGTNGKGSTANFINNILIENNYTVGMFSSPAVYAPNDRFKINNININDTDLYSYYEKVNNISKKLNIKLHEFEKATIISFLYFYDKKCDFAIIEVGIGGTIDATNVMTSTVVSLICKIGKDHTDMLGNTIQEITEQKAGIIKENGTVILYKQEEDVMNILIKKAKDKNNTIIIPDFNIIKILKHDKNNLKITYKDFIINLKMINEVQIYNAVMAIETVTYLNKIGYKIEEEKVLKGLENSKMEGRFQKVNDNPVVIIDGAHNIDSVKALNKTLKEVYPNENFVFIVGFYDDKEYAKLIEIMAPLGYAFISCMPESERAVESSDIYNLVGLFCDKVHNGKTLENSLDIAINNYMDKKIIIYGSLSLIRNVIEYFK
ncbi:bifunctional folylpolyglutamate synthase/dihydrofolate synthase [Miniphocaeibacter massiliensis]|uniref:bifunctional folylpolyglutamate synthase/dihydrofolate synthase n=1 Tax=Miniphocaeibacter massiliensis TaxID=2041841 RepID=UPI000C06DCCB|nr:cyanophycin synthetase [Miniphocaeibacter massiliensis]